MNPPIVPALFVLASLSVPASAQVLPSDTMVPAVVKTVTAEAVTVPAISLSRDRKSPILNDTELNTLRGGESLVITNQTMDSIVSGNVLKGDYTAGAVTLSDFALSNFNGVGNLLINTGAQVSAQSGMSLTINLGD
ncbi:MAG: hypothetical protein Q7T60_14665 [Sphingopyxis sp.]|nr:hypothetical protein [Sphingopyxis sp.]